MSELTTYLRAQWDRVGAWLLIGGGFLALLVGWIGISGTTVLAGQMPYIVSGGLLGLALIGVGAMLWLSADLQDEWRKLDAIHEALAGEQSPTSAPIAMNGEPARQPARR